MQRRIIVYPDLRSRYNIKYTRVHLNRMMGKGQFPQAVWLSPNRKGWFEDEVEEFIATRPTSRPAFPTEGASDAAD